MRNSETTVCSVVTCSARWGSVTKVFSHTSQLVKKTNGRETVCAKAPEEFGEVTLAHEDEYYHAHKSSLSAISIKFSVNDIKFHKDDTLPFMNSSNRLRVPSQFLRRRRSIRRFYLIYRIQHEIVDALFIVNMKISFYFETYSYYFMNVVQYE